MNQQPLTAVRGIEHGKCVTAEGEYLLADDLQRLLDVTPGGARVMCDGRPVKVAGVIGGQVMLDTGHDLPSPCPGCRTYTCDGRCREAQVGEAQMEPAPTDNSWLEMEDRRGRTRPL